MQGFVERLSSGKDSRLIFGGSYSLLPLLMKRLTLLTALALSPLLVQAQEAGSLIDELGSRTQFGIFTDFQTEFNDDDRSTQFYTGHLVGHVTTTLSRRMQYFAELSISPDDDHGGQASLERAFFQFFYSDLIQLRVGRIHTPVSTWNARFHHGQYLQTSINRPEVVRYSNRFTPIHSVVAEVNGSIPLEPGILSYMVGLGASDDHIHDREVADRLDKNPAWYAGIAFEPKGLLGLEVGVTTYAERFDSHSQGHEHEDHDLGLIDHERTWSGYVSFDRYRWSMIGEIMSVTHNGERSYGGSYGYYVQLEHQLPGQLHRAVLYSRYDQMDKNADDPIFRDHDCVLWRAVTTGVRINVAPRVALTTEFRMYGEDMTLQNRHLYLQISAAF